MIIKQMADLRMLAIMLTWGSLEFALIIILGKLKRENCRSEDVDKPVKRLGLFSKL